MASLAFLKSKPTYSAQLARPANYSKAGAYPSSYSIKYDEGSKSYEVTLADLRKITGQRRSKPGIASA
jgi:hypothetical protein